MSGDGTGLTIDELKEANESLGTGAGLASTFKEAIGNLTNAIGLLTNSLVKGKDGIAEMGHEIKDLTNDDKYKDFFKNLSSSIDRTSASLRKAGASSADMTASLILMSPALRGVMDASQTFGELGKGAEGATTQVGGLVQKFRSLSDAQKKELGISGAFLDIIEKGAQVRDQVINMENAFLRNQAAAGKLEGTVGQLGNRMDDVSLALEQFNSLNAEVGDTLGLTSAEVGKYFMALDAIPGTMDGLIDVHGDGAASVNQLEAALKVARGTHQDYGTVISQVDDMMSDYGLSTQESLESVSKMYSVTQNLGLRMNEVAGYTSKVGEAFKYLGTTAEGAQKNLTGSLAILQTLGPALKASGLGADAATELVGGFTQGLSQLTVAQKAFLSGQTGGRGGLVGGLEIEQMMAEGDISGVAEKVQQALEQQVGGRLVTREEAIDGGEGAARQFEFQRQLLQQGPFGQLAQTDQGASSLIEALQKGDFGAISEDMASGQKDLEKTFQDGTDIAERQTSELVKANNYLSQIANSAMVGVSNTVRAGDQLIGEQLQNSGLIEPSTNAASNLASTRVTSITDERFNEADLQSSGEKLTNKFKGVLNTLTGNIPELSVDSIMNSFNKGPVEGTAPEDQTTGANMRRFDPGLNIPALEGPESPRAAVAVPVQERQAQFSARNPDQSQTANGGSLGTIEVIVKTDTNGVLAVVNKEIKANNKKLLTMPEKQMSTGVSTLA